MRLALRLALLGFSVAGLLAMRLPAAPVAAGAAVACGLAGVAGLALGRRFPRLMWLAVPGLVALVVIRPSPTGVLAGLPWQAGAALAAFAVLVALGPLPVAPGLAPDGGRLPVRPWAWAATLLALGLPLAAGLLVAGLPGHVASVVEVRAGGAALLVAAGVMAACGAAALALLASRRAPEASDSATALASEGEEA